MVMTAEIRDALKRWDPSKKGWDATNEEVIRIVYGALKAESKKS